MILPLAFNHYRHAPASSERWGTEEDGKMEDAEIAQAVGQSSEEEEGSVPYVVAVFSAHELAYENVMTRPGFLSESLVLLAEKTGKVTQV